MSFAILRNPLPSSAAALPRSVGVSRLKRLDGPTWFGLAKPPQDRPPRLPPWRRCRHRPSAARNTCCERSARSCRVHAYADLRRNEHAERGPRPDAPLSLLLMARSCQSSLEFVPHRQQCFRTLFGASPVSKSPSERRIFAAKSAPLICTCGGFSSWKNIRSLKLPNRLISGTGAPGSPHNIG